MSRAPTVIDVSRTQARLRALEDFVLVHQPILTLTHPPYLSRKPIPLTVFEQGVIFSSSEDERRRTHRVTPPGSDDLVLQFLGCGEGRPPLRVVDLSLGGAKVAGAIGQLDLEPGQRARAWLRILGQPYVCVGVESVGARPWIGGGLAWGLRFGGISGEVEEWIARLVAACDEIAATRAAA